MIEWRVIPSAPDYEVSNRGQARRATQHKLASRWPVGREVNIFTNDAGYRKALIRSRDGKRRGRRIARLVAEAFLGPCPDGYEVNHEDGDKQNDAVENLEYATHGDNIRHAFAHGLVSRPTGERHHNAKLTDAQAADIRQQFVRAYGAKSAEKLAAHYGVSQVTILSIVRGAAYPASALTVANA